MLSDIKKLKLVRKHYFFVLKNNKKNLLNLKHNKP